MNPLKKLFLCGLLLSCSLSGFAQIPGLEKFYCENKLYKKLGVKTVIDSSTYSNPHMYIYDYDSLGRESGYKYITNADTLYRIYYGNKRPDSLVSIEQFIYSKTKKILKYTICTKYYEDRKVAAFINNFYYDDKDSLVTQVEYSKYTLNMNVTADIKITENDLDISNVLYYSYAGKTNQKYIIIKQGMGKLGWRKTDTLTYSGNKLIRTISFAKNSFHGELRYNNRSDITEYYYNNDTLTQKSYFVCCPFTSTDNSCIDWEREDQDNVILIFNKNGLVAKKFYSINNSEPSLISVYDYRFYTKP